MNTQSANQNDLLFLLRKENVVKRGSFTLKSGIKSNYYVDFRPLISKPELFYLICRHLEKLLPNKQDIPYFICGLPYARNSILFCYFNYKNDSYDNVA